MRPQTVAETACRIFGGLDLQSAVFPHPVFPGGPVIQGVGFLPRLLHVRLDIPLKKCGYIQHLPHHPPGVFIPEQMFPQMLPVPGKHGMHRRTGPPDPQLLIGLEMVRIDEFQRLIVEPDFGDFLPCVRADIHFPPVFVVLAVDLVDGAVGIVDFVPVAQAVEPDEIGEFRIRLDPQRDRVEVLVGYPAHGQIGHLLARFRRNGVGELPVTGGNDPPPGFPGIRGGAAVRALAPVRVVVVAEEITAFPARALRLDLADRRNQIVRDDLYVVGIGAAGLVLECQILFRIEILAFAVDQGETLRMLLKHLPVIGYALFRILCREITHVQTGEAVPAEAPGGAEFEGVLVHFRTRLGQSGSGIPFHVHIVADHPVPDGFEGPGPVRYAEMEGADLEGGIADFAHVRNADLGFDLEKFALRTRMDPADPAVFLQDLVGAVEQSQRSLRTHKQSIAFGLQLEAVLVDLRIPVQLEDDGGFARFRLVRNGGRLSSADLAQIERKLLRGITDGPVIPLRRDDRAGGFPVFHQRDIGIQQCA